VGIQKIFKSNTAVKNVIRLSLKMKPMKLLVQILVNVNAQNEVVVLLLSTGNKLTKYSWKQLFSRSLEVAHTQISIGSTETTLG